MIRHNLFTSSFNLYLKRLLGIIGGCLLFFFRLSGIRLYIQKRMKYLV